MPDAALDLFEQFRLGGYDRVARPVSEREAEGPYLDFKTNQREMGSGKEKTWVSQGALDGAARKVLYGYSALSGSNPRSLKRLSIVA